MAEPRCCCTDWIADLARTRALDGLTIALRGSCDPAERLRTLALDAVVPAGGRLRVVDDPADVRTGERYLGVDSCGTAGGRRWAALCAGACDLVTCRNVIDYMATVGAVGAPACTAMTPGPIDATAATATQSVTRAVFTATGAPGAAGEWSLQPTTPD